MTSKPIIIVAGEPNSIFFEIYFKAIKFKKFKSPLILIASFKLIKLQMKKMKVNKKIRLIDMRDLTKSRLDNKSINLINVNYDQSKPFEKISVKSNNYIKKSFNLALNILKKKISNKFINGPISKKHFLNKKYLGITEYLSHKSHSKSYAMLIYNEKLSVSPLTTHIPLKKVSTKITKKLIVEKVKLIDIFFKKIIKKKAKIAITGLNPHCESIDSFDEDNKIIRPAVKYLTKLKLNVFGPYAADTIFLKKNRKKFDVIVGMYHDQVLTPIKTLFEYNAINITLGLPFLRISPDHGPNEKMIGKNISDPISLMRSLEFLDKK